MIEGLENITEAFSLNADNARFSLSRTGLLYLSVPALSFEGRAFLSLAFPFETCEEYICVQNEEKEEIGMIRRLEDFDEKSIEILRGELNKKYFAPKILKILKLSERYGSTYWDCETDKGFLSFTVKDTHRSLIRAGADRIFVVDHDGCRYEIESVEKMDKKSHSKIALYL
ncbi:MAG: DUF1854 domain-containing protein [Clostridia bacterium]|nr:DUF1854 domain-containing protein [Clostridia bacterium]